MSVIGVYLPCLDQGVNCYRDHLIELEHVISDSQPMGPVVVLGDFNAHLSGAKCAGEQNLQGVMLQEVLEWCELSAVSQGALSSGPDYTYYSGDVRTTIDYILMDVDAASMMLSCYTHSMEDLNTSDHIPLTVSLCYDASQCKEDMSAGLKKIDWVEAKKNGSLEIFSEEVITRLEPLFTDVHDSADTICSEIEQVATVLTEMAESLLPCVKPKRKSRYKDNTLSCLCAQSHAAHVARRDAGSPSVGPLSDEKNRLRRAVRKRVRWCAAKAERMRNQRRDRLFTSQSNGRFRTPQKNKQSRCSKLVVGDTMVQDPEILLKVWAEHFHKLGETKLGDSLDACERKKRVETMEKQSYMNEEFLLDDPFSAEDVSGAIRRLKGRKEGTWS